MNASTNVLTLTGVTIDGVPTVVARSCPVPFAAFPDPHMGWGKIARDGLDIVELPLNPHAMLVEPFVQHLAAALANKLGRISREVQTDSFSRPDRPA